MQSLSMVSLPVVFRLICPLIFISLCAVVQIISLSYTIVRVAPNFGFGFDQAEIRPFFQNSAKFGFGQISGRIWQTPMQLQCVQLVT